MSVAVAVEAHVPLNEMFSHIEHLRAIFSGRAQYSMQSITARWHQPR